MATETSRTQQPVRCVRCGTPLTYALWFSGECPAYNGFGPLGHQTHFPGALLPLALDPESVREP